MDELDDPVQPSAPELNCHFNGDEARFILSLIVSPATKIAGDKILMATSIIRRLNEINVVQPPE